METLDLCNSKLRVKRRSHSPCHRDVAAYSSIRLIFPIHKTLTTLLKTYSCFDNVPASGQLNSKPQQTSTRIEITPLSENRFFMMRIDSTWFDVSPSQTDDGRRARADVPRSPDLTIMTPTSRGQAVVRNKHLRCAVAGRERETRLCRARAIAHHQKR